MVSLIDSPMTPPRNMTQETGISACRHVRRLMKGRQHANARIIVQGSRMSASSSMCIQANSSNVLERRVRASLGASGTVHPITPSAFRSVPVHVRGGFGTQSTFPVGIASLPESNPAAHTLPVAAGPWPGRYRRDCEGWSNPETVSGSRGVLASRRAAFGVRAVRVVVRAGSFRRAAYRRLRGRCVRRGRGVVSGVLPARRRGHPRERRR